MSIPNPKYVSELNELAQLSSDCAETYERAAEIVEQADLAGFCKRRAEERRVMAGQFRILVDELGEKAAEGGTIRGAVEKLVSESKGLVMDDTEAVLTELVRIEGHLKERCETFLDASTPSETTDLLNKHYDTIARGYRELQALAPSKSQT